MNLRTSNQLKEELFEHYVTEDLPLWELAQRIGLSTNWLSKFLNDKTNPKPRSLYRLQRYLDSQKKKVAV